MGHKGLKNIVVGLIRTLNCNSSQVQYESSKGWYGTFFSSTFNHCYYFFCVQSITQDQSL